jgi:hypothetical protein
LTDRGASIKKACADRLNCRSATLEYFLYPRVNIVKTFFLLVFIVSSGWLFLDRQKKLSEITELKSSLAEIQAKLANQVAVAAATPNPLPRHDLQRLLGPPAVTAGNPPVAPSPVSRNWIQEQIDKEKQKDSLAPPSASHRSGQHSLIEKH